jgi:hypothetical protein
MRLRKKKPVSQPNTMRWVGFTRTPEQVLHPEASTRRIHKKNKNKIKMKKEPTTVFLVNLLIFAYILLSKQTPHKPKQTKSNNYTNIL